MWGLRHRSRYSLFYTRDKPLWAITLKRITVEAEKCAGCRQCEMVCSFHHTKTFSPEASRVTVIKEDRLGLDYPLMCRQCSDCPPTEACPAKALTRLEGVIKVDLQACIGCGVCVEECRHGAVKLHEGKALICDLCGGDPRCVARCPTGALRYAESPELRETPREAFERLKKEWGMRG